MTTKSLPPSPMYGTPEGGFPVGSEEAKAAIERVKQKLARTNHPYATNKQRRGPKPRIIGKD